MKEHIQNLINNGIALDKAYNAIMKKETVIKENTGKDNYKVSVKIEKIVFLEGVSSRPEAALKGEAYVFELLQSGIKPFAIISVIKTNDTEEDIETLHIDQIKQLQKTSLDLSNAYNKKELQLLIEDLNFYIGT